MNTSNGHGPPRVQLYAKPGCHLCEQVEADLARLRRRYAHHIEVVDISQSPELMARYGLRIPVIVIGGHEYGAPLEFADIERALAETASSQAGAPEAIHHGT